MPYTDNCSVIIRPEASMWRPSGPRITFQSNPSMAGSPLRLLGPDFDLIRLRIDFSPPLGEDLCVRAVLDHIHQHAVDLVAKIGVALADTHGIRSEEQTSELQSLMRHSYDV